MFLTMKWRAFFIAVLTGLGTFAMGYAPVALDCYDGKIAIALQEGKKIELFDAGAGKSTATIDLKYKPNGILVKGDKAYVTTGGVHGRLLIVDLKTKKIDKEIALGHTPMSPFERDGLLYVCNRFDNNVSIIDLKKGEVIKSLEADREAVGVVASKDGKKVFIANLLPNVASDGDYVAAALTVYDGDEKKNIRLSNGTQAVRGIEISHDGKYVVLTHVLSRFQLPTTQVDKGWMNTNGFTIVDVDNPSEYKTVLLDDPDAGAANPWAVKFAKDDQKLVVSHAGTHEISIIDFPALMEKLGKEETAVNELGYLNNIRQRVPLPVNGLRSMVIDGDKVYCAGFFSDGLVSVTLTKYPSIASWSIATTKPKDEKTRMGESYYNDAAYCFQTWQSCVSCHPDTRVDGLNWDLLNDGMGNPKNTRSMFMSHRTPPVMTLGIRKDAETAVNAGFHHIQFVDVSADVLECVNYYLGSMPQVASPALRRDMPEKVKTKKQECMLCHDPAIERGMLSDSAKRGKKIFKESGCTECHPHPYFTTKEPLDVGTLKGMDQEEGRKVLVPTLSEVWRTAPYMHDGRAATLEEAVTIHNPDNKRGKTKNLSKDQVKDLVEYIRSL